MFADTLFRDQVALVTGGGTGLGLGIASRLGALGARVVIASRNRAHLDAGVSTLAAAGVDALAVVVDVREPDQVVRMVAEALARFGRIDILVLNASQRREVLFKDMTFEEWRNTMSITLDGSFHCIKACLPSMIANARGNIVTLGGDAVLLGGNRKAHNTAAKNGLVRMGQLAYRR